MSYENSIGVLMVEYAKWLHEHKERLRWMPENERIDLFFDEVVTKTLTAEPRP